jgi:hypothetical protein
MLLGKLDALASIRFGAGVGTAPTKIEFPTRLFPAIEAGILDEFEPSFHGHVAELATHQADLMVGSFAVTMFRGLPEAHVVCFSFPGH